MCGAWPMRSPSQFESGMPHSTVACAKDHILSVYLLVSLCLSSLLSFCTFVTNARLFFAFAASLSLPSPLVGVFLCSLCSCVLGFSPSRFCFRLFWISLTFDGAWHVLSTLFVSTCLPYASPVRLFSQSDAVCSSCVLNKTVCLFIYLFLYPFLLRVEKVYVFVEM